MHKFGISVSSINLNFQSRHLIEVMAGFDRHLTLQILNCMNPFCVSFKVKMALFQAATFEFPFSKKTSWYAAYKYNKLLQTMGGLTTLLVTHMHHALLTLIIMSYSSNTFVIALLPQQTQAATLLCCMAEEW